MFSVPNEGSATYPPQAAVDSVDVDALVLGDQGTGVASGCLVSQQTVANMTVQVAAGIIMVAGLPITVSAAASVTIAAADSSHDRKDIIVCPNGTSPVPVAVTGTVSAGTVAGVTASGQRDPVKPAIPANNVLLAEVYVPAAATTIAAANLVDKRAAVPALTSAVNTDAMVFMGAW